MIAAMFFLLVAVCAFLAIRLHAAKLENADLRVNIAHLRRRLNQRP